MGTYKPTWRITQQDERKIKRDRAFGKLSKEDEKCIRHEASVFRDAVKRKYGREMKNVGDEGLMELFCAVGVWLAGVENDKTEYETSSTSRD